MTCILKAIQWLIGQSNGTLTKSIELFNAMCCESRSFLIFRKKWGHCPPAIRAPRPIGTPQTD